MSDEAKIAQKAPYPVEVEAGETYYWCACGHSRNQPFCDGSHQGTGFEPVAFTAEKSETAYLCGCKRTANKPFCDGSHTSLD
jgi:CDGSH-type Zn-finger protein